VGFFLANRKAAFRYPLGPAPRTAVLAPWFRSGAAVRVFPNGWDSSTAIYSPAAIAGTPEQLLHLTDAHPTHALIALERPGDALLTAAERDQLWRTFRVPVFEQIVGEDGAVLAAECEAHDGLHVEVERDWQGYSIEHACCACGVRTPRLSSPQPAERVRSAATYAR
jgi:hypothetical protein